MKILRWLVLEAETDFFYKNKALPTLNTHKKLGFFSIYMQVLVILQHKEPKI